MKEEKIKDVEWGKNVSVKFYLDTRLKPTTIGERKNLYPLYVRVIFQRKMTQFKYFGFNPISREIDSELYTKVEFDKLIAQIDINTLDAKKVSTLSRKKDRYSLFSLYVLREDIIFLLDFLDAGDRKNFKIKNLPILLKAYYELEKELDESKRNVLSETLYNLKPYSELFEILNWRHDPEWIHLTLNDLRDSFPQFPEIPKITDSIPFVQCSQILNLVKENKNLLHGDLEMASTKLANQIMIDGRFSKRRSIVGLLILKAINFYFTSLKIISK